MIWNKKAFVVTVVLAAIVGAGSLATVPQATSKATSPLAVTFTPDTDANEVESGGTTGSTITTRQKVVVNLVQDVSEDAQIALHLQNTSEDRQLFLFVANATSNVILDMEAVDSCGTVHGITAENKWLASIAGGSTACKFSIEVSVKEPDTYTITVEVQRVG